MRAELLEVEVDLRSAGPDDGEPRWSRGVIRLLIIGPLKLLERAFLSRSAFSQREVARVREEYHNNNVG